MASSSRVSSVWIMVLFQKMMTGMQMMNLKIITSTW